MMAMDNPRFDKTKFHQAAGTKGYEAPPKSKKKTESVAAMFNRDSASGLRAEMVVNLATQKANPIYVHEALNTQFGRIFDAFEESLSPVSPATNPSPNLVPADHASVNTGATPDENVSADAMPEHANNANPPMKEAARRQRSTQEGRFLRARYGRNLAEEGDPFTGEPTVDSENDNPNNEETPSDSGQFYTASPEAQAATQAAQDLNAPTAEIESLGSLEGDEGTPDQVAFNIPATQAESAVLEMVKTGIIKYMPEEYQLIAANLVERGVIPASAIEEESFEDFIDPLKDDDRLIKRKIESRVDEYSWNAVGDVARGAVGVVKAHPAIAGGIAGFVADREVEKHAQRRQAAEEEPRHESVNESDYDHQLQVGTLVYAKGVEGVPNGTQGQITTQMPTEVGFLYLTQFDGNATGKLVRQDQLTV
jgi:hypothetical protein